MCFFNFKNARCLFFFDLVMLGICPKTNLQYFKDRASGYNSRNCTTILAITIRVQVSFCLMCGVHFRLTLPLRREGPPFYTPRFYDFKYCNLDSIVSYLWLRLLILGIYPPTTYLISPDELNGYTLMNCKFSIIRCWRLFYI